MFRFEVLYLCMDQEARCFSSQACQFLTRLYKEYRLAGGGVTSSAQEPTKKVLRQMIGVFGLDSKKTSMVFLLILKTCNGIPPLCQSIFTNIFSVFSLYCEDVIDTIDKKCL